MMITSRAFAGILALGLVAGCPSDDAASPSEDGTDGTSSGTDSAPSATTPSDSEATTPDTTGSPTSSSAGEVTTSDTDSTTGSPTDPTSGGSSSEGSSGDTDDSDSDSTTGTDGGSSSTGSSLEGGSTESGGAEPFCGDGNLDDGEQCDDGLDNADNADCTASCTTNVCGDGYVHAFAEACDDGNEDTTDSCISCVAASCGDGFVFAEVEDCDDGNADDLDACRDDCSAHEVTKISIGGDHTCALFDSGRVKCWGNGASGRLGYGNTETIGDDETPADVDFIDVGANVEEIITGVSHTCVGLSDGSIKCFGSAAVGQLGYASNAALGDNELVSSLGTLVLGDAAVAMGSGGGAFHSCAALDDDTVQCWGQHTTGKLGILGQDNPVGDNETPFSAGPTDLGGVARSFSMGVAHSCARLQSGQLRCWGSGANGQLGYGNGDTIGDDETPASAGDVPISDVSTQVVAGWYHTCAVLEGGPVQCWGRGNDGRLGYGNTQYVGVAQTPADVGTVALDGPALKVVAGLAHTCALLQDGSVQCWGFGANGQLGYGDTQSIGDDERPADVGVNTLSVAARDIAADGNHTCIITEAGGVKCWGHGGQGRLGYGDTESLGDDESLATLADVPLLATAAD